MSGKKGGGHGPGKKSTRMHGLRTATPRKKNKRWPKKGGAPGSSRTSGSYVQRQRLAKMREQNPSKTKEEAEQQRLAAIGRAKFQRIHGRQQKQMAAKMEEQQAKLDMQQQQLQQLQQQLYWQQSQQTQWQWQQPAVSWVLPQSGYLIHPGLALVISLSGMLFCNHDFLSFIFPCILHLFCFRWWWWWWWWWWQPHGHWWCCLLLRHTLCQSSFSCQQKIAVIVVCCLLLSGDMHDWSMRKMSIIFAYVPYEMKQRRKENRKATQKSNKRKGSGDGPSVDESRSNWDDTGYGGSSASSSWTWRPKNR